MILNLLSIVLLLLILFLLLLLLLLERKNERECDAARSNQKIHHQSVKRPTARTRPWVSSLPRPRSL